MVVFPCCVEQFRSRHRGSRELVLSGDSNNARERRGTREGYAGEQSNDQLWTLSCSTGEGRTSEERVIVVSGSGAGGSQASMGLVSLGAEVLEMGQRGLGQRFWKGSSSW